MTERPSTPQAGSPLVHPHPERVLIIGIGNAFREDDIAGLLVAQACRRLLPDATAEVEEHGGEGASLMARWEGAETVILCDAVSARETPGTVVRIEAHRESFPQGMRACSSHAFGVAEAIEMARVLGRIPARLIVYGIVGKRFGTGAEISPEVQPGIDRAVRMICGEVCTPREGHDR